MKIKMILLLSCIGILAGCQSSSATISCVGPASGYSMGYGCRSACGGCGTQRSPCRRTCGSGCAVYQSQCVTCNLSGCHQDNACGCDPNCGNSLWENGCQSCYNHCFGNIGHTDSTGCYVDDP